MDSELEKKPTDVMLEHEWSLYYDAPSSARDRSASWSSDRTKLGDVKTIGQYWSFFNNLTAPSRLPVEGTYSIFQSHIVPAWEDPHNASGGEVRVFFNKASHSAIETAFSNLALSMIGESLLETDDIGVCGLTVARKKHKCKISVWIDKSDAPAQAALESAMRKMIGIDVLSKLNLSLEWTSHKQLMDKEKLKDVGLTRSSSSNSNTYRPRNMKMMRPPSDGGSGFMKN